MVHTTSPDLIALEPLPVRAGAPVRRRMGSPAALAAALAALEPSTDAKEAEWLAQLAALEEARQAVLDDRLNWLAGAPTVRVMVSIIRDSATNCHK